MQAKHYLSLVCFFFIAVAQSTPQQNAESWVKALIVDSRQQKVHLEGLQTLELAYTREFLDEQGDVESQSVIKSAVNFEDDSAYLETMTLQDGENKTNILITIAEGGCSIYDNEVETLSPEDRETYVELLSNPTGSVMPLDASATDIQYVSEFSVPDLISGERVDLVYTGDPMSYIFDNEGEILGTLNEEELTVQLAQDKRIPAEQSALNYDKYLLNGDESRLIERSRVTEYAEDAPLDESLFNCPEIE